MSIVYKFAMIASIVAFTTGCGEKANEEDCKAALSKIIEFEMGLSGPMAKAALESPDVMKSCVGEIAKKDAQCIAKASSKEEYEKCK